MIKVPDIQIRKVFKTVVHNVEKMVKDIQYVDRIIEIPVVKTVIREQEKIVDVEVENIVIDTKIEE